MNNNESNPLYTSICNHIAQRVYWSRAIRAFCVVLLCVLGLPLQASAPTQANAPARAAQPQVGGVFSGRVFRDLNFNGQPDSNEPGVASVMVSAYNTAGALVASSQTITDGVYALTSPTLTAPLRLELTGLPTGFFPSVYRPLSSDSGTLVRFVTQPGTGYNFALTNPTDYCNSTPQIATNCFVYGNALTGPYKNLASITAFPYNAGTASLESNTGVRDPITRSVNISNSLVGSTWGLAFQRETNTLFAAAFTKRHAGFGPGGTGGIYQINPLSNTASLLLNLNTLFPGSTGEDPHDLNYFYLDTLTWDKVGKTSLGGIDLSDDGETLWAMNLYDRRLYRLPIGIPAASPSASAVISYTSPDPGTGPTGCVLHSQTPLGERNLNLRPFAVKVLGGNVFVGWVCTAESTQLRKDMRAFVYKLDVATGNYTQLANFSLNYPRGCVSGYDTCNSAVWNPWSPTPRANYFYQFQESDYAQAMLSDIEFDDAGNMIVSLGDRFGHQSSEDRPELTTDPSLEGAMAGDVLKLFPTDAAATNYQLENNARLGTGAATAGQNNGQGPGGGEFYYRDTFPINTINLGLHQELATGGLAVLPNSGQVVVSAYNPTPRFEDVNGQSTFRTVGPLWFDNTTGTRTGSYMIIQYVEPGYFTKATGMGDVELMCDSAPIEVGNRVWLDMNGNGIQDPDEPASPGVTVHLYPFSGTQVSPTPIATTTTDAQGRYSFSSAGRDGVQFSADDLGNFGPDGLPNTADDLALPGLKPSTTRITNRYAIRLDNLNDYYPGRPLADFSPTAPNVNSGFNADARDSDAVLINGYAQLIFTTGHSGQNNDSLDFGFSQPAKLSGRVWVDADHNGVRVPTDAVISGTRITAAGPGSLFLSTLTDDTGAYAFNAMPPGVYTITFSLPSGYTFTFPLSGDPAFDSDVVRPDGTTYTITLRSGNDVRDVDAGLWKPAPSIELQALTNGLDATNDSGPLVSYASPITWTYRVTNTGDITLSRILVLDEPQGVIICPAFELAPGQGMSCDLPGVAAGGQYTNNVSVSSTDFVTPRAITDTAISHHFGLITPTVQIKKFTNGQSADAAPGLALVNGTPITWTYVVTNTGNVPFNAISIVDDREGAIACATYDLAVGQSKTCLRSGKVISGVYENTAVVTGTYNVPNVKGTVSASAISHYTGYAPASVGGLVWVDRNLSGVFETGELPLFGVTATLLSLSGTAATPVATLRTDGDGRYSFKNLLPGNYSVLFTPLPGYRFTSPGLGDPALNSDADPATGRTPTFVVAAGEVNTTIGAGFFTELPRLSVRVIVNGLDSDVAPGPLLETGTPLEWVYIVQNTGEITLTQIRVGDDKSGPLTSCNLDFLGPGKSFTCNRVSVVASGSLVSAVTVTGTIPGTTAGEGGPVSPASFVTSNATSYYVGGFANLSLQKDSVPISNSALVTGNLVTYSLSVSNMGTFTATSVVVSDVLPAGLGYVSGSTGVSVVSSTESIVVSWNMGGLGLKQSRTVTVVAKAIGAPAQGKTFNNVGFAASTQTRQTHSNLVAHQLKPTAIQLMDFSVVAPANATAKGVTIQWRTGAELNTFGFGLYRSTTSDRSQAMPLGQLIPAKGGNTNYQFADADGSANHFYWLSEIDRDGISTEFGPVRVATALPVLVAPNVVAGGGAVVVPLDSLASSNSAIDIKPSSSAVETSQQSVAVQAQPIPLGKPIVQADQRATNSVPSLPSVATVPEASPTQSTLAADAPNAPQPKAQIEQPASPQPAVSAKQSGDAAVQSVSVQPRTATQQPTSSPVFNGWFVLIGALLMLMVIASSLLSLLVHHLRSR